MNRYLKSRGMGWSISNVRDVFPDKDKSDTQNPLFQTGTSLYKAGEEVVDGVSGVSDIFTPFGEAIDDAMNYEIDDIAYDILPDWIWDKARDAVDYATTGNAQKAWTEFHNMSIRDAIRESIGGLSDSVTVEHGRVMDPRNYNEKYRYPQHVSLVRGSEPMLDRQNLFTMFGDDSPYNQTRFRDTISVGEIDGAFHSSGRIYAPFSKFTPTALWPWQTTQGKRMTAADLAEVPLDSDWFGTKPIAEAVIGQKLDKVGGIPGYRFFGDLALAGPAIGMVALGCAALFFTWPLIAGVGTKVFTDIGLGTAQGILAIPNP